MSDIKIRSIPKATHQGTLDINGIEISCAVLEDGRRVVSETSLANSLGISRSGGYWEKKRREGTSVPRYLYAKYLDPYISDELRAKLLEPVIYKPTAGASAKGVPAEVLPEICDVWIKAGEEGTVSKARQDIPKTAYLLMKGFAKVGIIALVDEATGYQYEREHNELQKILKSYISEELLEWQKRFPDEFYKEIFRLNGWGDLTVPGINFQKRPGVIGTWTKKLIYQKLPRGVLQELVRKTPKNSAGKLSKRLHQSLTIDIGHPHLEKQLVSVITLMNISKDWNEFMGFFNKKFGQQELDFESDEHRGLIEPTQKKVKGSDFNKSLKGLLSVPPPKKGEN